MDSLSHRLARGVPNLNIGVASKHSLNLLILRGQARETYLWSTACASVGRVSRQNLSCCACRELSIMMYQRRLSLPSSWLVWLYDEINSQNQEAQSMRRQEGRRDFYFIFWISINKCSLARSQGTLPVLRQLFDHVFLNRVLMTNIIWGHSLVAVMVNILYTNCKVLQYLLI